MNQNANHPNNDTNTAGFPPAPPKAHQRADVSKTRLPGRIIPDGFEVIAEVESMGLLIAVNGVLAMGWSGRRKKRDFYIRYSSVERRNDRLVEYIEGVEALAAYRAERRGAKSGGHGLAVGAVLRASWGYDQTNIDFYEVVKLNGKTMVSVRPLAQDTDQSGDMSGACRPLPGQFTGEATRCRVDCSNNSIKIGHTRAYLFEPETVEGEKVWPASYFTSYA